MTTTDANAPETFNAFLDRTCRTRKTNLCVGLDPDASRLRQILGTRTEPDSELCLRVMLSVAAATAPFAAALKPNAAFFEALEDSRPLMPQIGENLAENYPDTIAICDAKRGDIGNTSVQYAWAVFKKQRFGAVTVNPLMGHDAVEPFLSHPDKGVFLLCLTSNPGADDFLLKNDLYLRIAEKAVTWNRNDNIGLVVGATRPEYLARIREIAPDLPLLIPGIGAQGGKLDETLHAINARENRRFIINASRSVLYPPNANAENYITKTAEAAASIRDEIQTQLND